MLDAKTLYELIERARSQYKTKKIHLPEQHYDRQKYAMHPSELGYCDLKSALQASGLPPDYEMENEWLMDHGNYVAPMIQEPLMLYAMQHPDIAFIPEHIMEGAAMWDGYSTQMYQGKADGLLYYEGEPYILEIKDTEGVIKRSVGEPSIKYCMQSMAYKLLADGSLNSSFIITCSKWGFSVYELRWVGTGFMLFDRWGKPYEVPAWSKEDWNTPAHLNYVEVIKAINKKQALIDRARAARERWAAVDIDELVFDNKIKDPLNDKEQGWLCVWHYDKGTKTRGGEAKPNCPFAKRCHGWENVTLLTQKSASGGYEFEVS